MNHLEAFIRKCFLNARANRWGEPDLGHQNEGLREVVARENLCEQFQVNTRLSGASHTVKK